MIKWDYYWNEEPGDRFRANLVYTAYISSDKKTLKMSFNRDVNYHTNLIENLDWTEELLTERFNRELKFHKIASIKIPVAEILDVIDHKREIYLRFPGEDFYMMGYRSSYHQVLPNWKEQMIKRFEEMWSLDIIKLSLHPNSWIVYDDGILRPFNWFFTFYQDETVLSLNDLMIQISDSRKNSLLSILEKNQWNVEEKYDLKTLQDIALESFKKNYDNELIKKLKQIKKTYHHLG